MNQGPRTPTAADEDRLFTFAGDPSATASTDLEASVQRVQRALGGAPTGATAAPAALRRQIWEELMQRQAATPGGGAPDPATPVAVMPPPRSTQPRHPRHPHLFWNAASRILLAAVLILAISAGIWRASRSFEFGFGDGSPTEESLGFAGAATPTPTPYPLADHPIIGVWQFDIEIRQPGTDLAYFTFIADGTFVAFGERGDWVAFGNWRATGARTAELFYVLQGIPAQDVFATDYVPAVTVFEPGIITLRLALVIDAAGTTVTAEGEGTIYADDGTVAQTFDGDNARMIGTRMAVVATVPATPSS